MVSNTSIKQFFLQAKTMKDLKEIKAKNPMLKDSRYELFSFIFQMQRKLLRIYYLIF